MGGILERSDKLCPCKLHEQHREIQRAVTDHHRQHKALEEGGFVKLHFPHHQAMTAMVFFVDIQREQCFPCSEPQGCRKGFVRAMIEPAFCDLQILYTGTVEHIQKAYFVHKLFLVVVELEGNRQHGTLEVFTNILPSIVLVEFDEPILLITLAVDATIVQLTANHSTTI